MKKLIRNAALLGGLLTVAGLVAAPAANDYPVIRKALAQVVPGARPDSIRPSQVEGLYEVNYGAQLFYISEDGRYLLQGHVLDLTTRTDLTEARQGDLRLAAIEKIGADNMIVFPAAKEQHQVTVFTDIDCGYCRKLHDEMQAMNDLGITVRYLFFPRTGPNTPSYQKAVSVWCAEDQRQALTEAKAGQDIPTKSCTNPIDSHMQLVGEFGVNGTPAIILDDGRMLPGYLPAARLQAMLKQQPPQ